MIKRKFLTLVIFSIVVFFSILGFLPTANAYDYSFSDSEDDIIRKCGDQIDTGDYHDEIDISNLIIAGKNINLTVVGDLGNWNGSYEGRIHFSERFLPESSYNYVWTLPYYIIDFENKSGPIEAILKRGYSLGGGNFAYEQWNGTGWESRTSMASILTAVSAHSIIIDIPVGVEPISTNMKVLAYTYIYLECDYFDFAPSLSVFETENGIPSFSLLIIICAITGISLIMIKNTKNRRLFH